MKNFSYLFVIFGVLWCLLGGYYLWMKNDTNRLKFKNYPVAASITQTVAPAKQAQQRIIINDLGINLPLIPARIQNDTWETTNFGASYLISSPTPGETGNSIIYAHNWMSLFGNLTRAKPGEEVDVTAADGSTKKFIIEYTSVVTPDESNILAQTRDKRITLYTCTGFLDSKRFVVVAILKDEKASQKLSAALNH